MSLIEQDDNIPKYKSRLIYVLSKYATYEQLDEYHNKGLVDLMNIDIIGTILASNFPGEIYKNYSKQDYERDYNRFLYILDYYLGKGLTYQDILESVTTDNIEYRFPGKLKIVLYLINKGEVDFKKRYNESDSAKEYLDMVILSQV